MRRTDQFTSGRSSSQRTPVMASMSGQTSAGTPSLFHLETDALETLRPSGSRADSLAVSNSASRDVPLTALHACSSGEIASVSIAVSGNDTGKYSLPKLIDCNKAALLYAHLMGLKERLRQAREALDLSGEVVGAQVGVSKSTISHWENGRYEPSVEQIRGLCNVLKVTPNWLFEMDAVDLPPDAIEEARAYVGLSTEDRRKWKALRRTMFSMA